MGDRGNIAVLHDEKRTQQVWLYSHWGGRDLPQLLQAGLKAGKSRYDDPSYLNKIIFANAISPQVWQGETGAGISTAIGDNEHKILCVDIPGQRVFLIEEDQLNDAGQVPADFKPDAAQVWSFEEYAALETLPNT